MHRFGVCPVSTALGGGFASPVAYWDGEPVGSAGQIGDVGRQIVEAVEWDVTQGPHLIPIPKHPEAHKAS